MENNKYTKEQKKKMNALKVSLVLGAAAIAGGFATIFTITFPNSKDSELPKEDEEISEPSSPDSPGDNDSGESGEDGSDTPSNPGEGEENSGEGGSDTPSNPGEGEENSGEGGGSDTPSPDEDEDDYSLLLDHVTLDQEKFYYYHDNGQGLAYDGLYYQYGSQKDATEDWMAYAPESSGKSTYGNETVIDTCFYFQYLYEVQYDDEIVAYGKDINMLKNNLPCFALNFQSNYKIDYYWEGTDDNGHWVEFTSTSHFIEVLTSTVLKGEKIWLGNSVDQREFPFSVKICENFDDIVTVMNNIINSQ